MSASEKTSVGWLPSLHVAKDQHRKVLRGVTEL
jgi:hypothetical protein